MKTDTEVHRLVLPSGHIAVVDQADAELVEGYWWWARVDPRTVYVAGRRHRRGPIVRLHRLLLNPPQGVGVDHRDGDGLNNRRSNLRFATVVQNAGNQRLSSRNTTGYKGVAASHRDRRKWRAYITDRGRQRHLGTFADPWDAAQAYNAAALEQWGEFARLNEFSPPP